MHYLSTSPKTNYGKVIGRGAQPCSAVHNYCHTHYRHAVPMLAILNVQDNLLCLMKSYRIEESSTGPHEQLRISVLLLQSLAILNSKQVASIPPYFTVSFFCATVS